MVASVVVVLRVEATVTRQWHRTLALVRRDLNNRSVVESQRPLVDKQAGFSSVFAGVCGRVCEDMRLPEGAVTALLHNDRLLGPTLPARHHNHHPLPTAPPTTFPLLHSLLPLLLLLYHYYHSTRLTLYCHHMVAGSCVHGGQK